MELAVALGIEGARNSMTNSRHSPAKVSEFRPATGGPSLRFVSVLLGSGKTVKEGGSTQKEAVSREKVLEGPGRLPFRNWRLAMGGGS